MEFEESILMHIKVILQEFEESVLIMVFEESILIGIKVIRGVECPENFPS
jgi:hypothetical protein